MPSGVQAVPQPGAMGVVGVRDRTGHLPRAAGTRAADGEDRGVAVVERLDADSAAQRQVGPPAPLILAVERRLRVRERRRATLAQSTAAEPAELPVLTP